MSNRLISCCCRFSAFTGEAEQECPRHENLRKEHYSFRKALVAIDEALSEHTDIAPTATRMIARKALGYD